MPSHKTGMRKTNTGINALMLFIFFFNLFSFLGTGIFRDGFLRLQMASAQELQDYAEDINLSVGQIKTVPVSNPKRVAVANPDIVDVQSVATKEIILAPKAIGLTALTVWDDYGEHSYQLKVINEELSSIKQHADSLIKELHLPKVATKVNYAEGKLLLTGEVDDINEKERLLSSLTSIKDKILDMITLKEESTLVQIDAQILELNRDNFRNLGIEYQQSVALTDGADKTMNHITDMFATRLWTRSKLDVTLNLLVKEGKARILSQPKLVCLSGKEAEFLVGGEVPILTSTISTTSTSFNVQYKKYGVTLKIKPTAKDNANIFLDLSTEVSELDLTNAVGTRTGSNFAPAFTTRNMQTGLSLQDGQSLFIAGLIKNKDSNTIKRFPFLGDVPVLGMLWRSRDFENHQTELVILLTPTVVKSSRSAQNVAQVKDTASQNMPGKKNSQSDNMLIEPDVNLQAYIEDIKKQIISSLDSPGLASETGSKGTVKVRVRILADGRLKDTLIITSSGSALLDNAVIKTIRKLSPFPSFPSTVKNDEIAVDIPIVYS